MKKKVLLVGPIGDNGGRELEAGFIASSLSENYHVNLISTGLFSSNSQVFDFKGFNSENLPELILNSSLPVKFSTRILNFFSNKKNNQTDYLYSPLFKKIFKIENRKEKILKNKIKQNDIIFILAQVTSNYLKTIINFSTIQNKKIIFRTTGFIEHSSNDLIFLKSVDLFIHNSFLNSQRLKNNNNFDIIDQCAFDEKNLLKMPLLNKKINVFYTIARLVKSKNVDKIVNAFSKSGDKDDVLYVIGDGSELINLKKVKDPRIKFTGHVENKKLIKFYEKCGCLILPYYKFEAGPLTAIDALASGRIIISTKTGAMQERLDDDFSFWHNNDINEIINSINKVKAMSAEQVLQTSKRHREIYLKNYTKRIIKNKYIDTLKTIE